MSLGRREGRREPGTGGGSVSEEERGRTFGITNGRVGKAGGQRHVEVRAGRLSDSSAFLRRAEARSRAHSEEGEEGLEAGRRRGRWESQRSSKGAGSGVSGGVWVGSPRTQGVRAASTPASLLPHTAAFSLSRCLCCYFFLIYHLVLSREPSLGAPPHSFPRILTAACALFPLYPSSCPWTLSLVSLLPLPLSFY